jgi:hypothetical protein
MYGSRVAIGVPCGFASEIHEHRWRPTSARTSEVSMSHCGLGGAGVVRP